MSQVDEILKFFQQYSMETVCGDSSLDNNNSVVFRMKKVGVNTCMDFVGNIAKFAFSQNLKESDFKLDFCQIDFKNNLIRYNKECAASSVNSISTASTFKTVASNSVQTFDQVKENKKQKQLKKALKKKEKEEAKKQTKLKKDRPQVVEDDSSSGGTGCSGTKLTPKKEKKPDFLNSKRCKRGKGSQNITKLNKKRHGYED